MTTTTPDQSESAALVVSQSSGQLWGFVRGAYFLVKFTMLGLAIMSMSVFMVAEGRLLSRPLEVLFAVWTIVSAVLAWWFLSSVRASARPFGLLAQVAR
jgi:hypothetical protein